MIHKCFISFKTEDMAYKKAIQEMDIDMIDKSLDDAIDSNDEEYIMQKIRQEYLADSTVTIHLIGNSSAENLGEYEQRFIKRELQGSLYDGENNTRNGILGVVLPHAYNKIYAGGSQCISCGEKVTFINVNDNTTVREFSYNYYIPNGKCHHSEDDRFCVLVKWDDFIQYPSLYIEKAFIKRQHPIISKVKVRP